MRTAGLRFICGTDKSVPYVEKGINMKELKIIDIQLFAEGGNGDAEEGGTGESGMQNADEAQSDDEVQNAECKMQSAECKAQSDDEDKMNEGNNSDVLNDEAGIEDDEVVTEETEEEEFIREREERLRNRISGWLKESGEIKELYPDFDLRNELRSSPLFSRLVLSGAPLQAAYEIVHKDEILSGAMAYTADKVREQVVKNIETKGRRPLENGISSESAVMTAVDVNALTAKDIHKILKQVENGASIKF